MKKFPISEVRSMFPSLKVTDKGRRRIYFDNPAGTQVPQRVIDAVSEIYLRYNSNSGVYNATSIAIDELAKISYAAIATFLGAPDPFEIVIGPSSTSLAFQLSRSLAHWLNPGDEIILTKMDHEGNISPWLEVAKEKKLTIRWLSFNKDSWKIEKEDLVDLLTERTKFLALNYASNLTGAINNVTELTGVAKSVGALVYVDAVQFAPHQPVNVQELGCDFLSCSPYKFFGPHLGVVWGKKELLEKMHAYKCRCASDLLPDRFAIGTQQFELMSGLLATIEYFEDLGRMVGGKGDRRSLIEAAYFASNTYEEHLSSIILEEIASIPEITLHGPQKSVGSGERVPTFSFTHQHLSSSKLAKLLSEQGIFCHWGHNYAFEVAKALAIDQNEGVVRVGFAHYNTEAEIEEMLSSLRVILKY